MESSLRLSENHQYRQVIDAEGCIVTAGLIDYHVHYMRGASEGGVQADVVSFCSGITTVVDGGTAGTGMYEHIYRTIVANPQVRFLNLLVGSVRRIVQQPVSGESGSGTDG